jgi:cytochrome d ubiquinol oxidase subunit I
MPVRDFLKSLSATYRNRCPGLSETRTAGFVAVIAGWVTTEVGRQPYTVYGYLLTAQSHSPLQASAVAASLLTFVIVYFLVFGAGTYYLIRLMAKPPAPHETEPSSTPQRAAGITPAPALSSEGGSHAV